MNSGVITNQLTLPVDHLMMLSVLVVEVDFVDVAAERLFHPLRRRQRQRFWHHYYSL